MIIISVPEGKRSKSKFELFVKAQFLASHTARILANENIFKPNIDNILIEKIKTCAYDIYAKSWSANKIRAETSDINRMTRYSLQMEVITLCDELLAYIGIAKQLYHLRSKKVKYWANLVVEVRKMLQAWKESDVKRYGKP